MSDDVYTREGSWQRREREKREAERRLLEQLRPHMVEVKVEYKGVYGPGDEFTVRA